jgi:hypothetical protein
MSENWQILVVAIELSNQLLPVKLADTADFFVAAKQAS